MCTNSVRSSLRTNSVAVTKGKELMVHRETIRCWVWELCGIIVHCACKMWRFRSARNTITKGDCKLGHVCPSAWKGTFPNGNIWDFYYNLWSYYHFGENGTKMTGALLEDLYTFMWLVFKTKTDCVLCEVRVEAGAIVDDLHIRVKEIDFRLNLRV